MGKYIVSPIHYVVLIPTDNQKRTNKAYNERVREDIWLYETTSNNMQQTEIFSLEKRREHRYDRDLQNHELYAGGKEGTTVVQLLIFALPSSKRTYENPVKLSDKGFSLKQKRNTFNNTAIAELTAQADSGN